MSISFEGAWEKGENNTLVDSFCFFESGSTMPHRGIELPLPALIFGNGFNGAAALDVLQHQINHHSPLHEIDLVLLIYDFRQRWAPVPSNRDCRIPFHHRCPPRLPMRPRPAHAFPLPPLFLPSLDSTYDVPHHRKCLARNAPVIIAFPSQSQSDLGVLESVHPDARWASHEFRPSFASSSRCCCRKRFNGVGRRRQRFESWRSWRSFPPKSQVDD